MPVPNEKNRIQKQAEAEKVAFINGAYKFYLANFCKTKAEISTAKDSPNFITFLVQYKNAYDSYLGKGYTAEAIPSHLSKIDFKKNMSLSSLDSISAQASLPIVGRKPSP